MIERAGRPPTVHRINVLVTRYTGLPPVPVIEPPVEEPHGFPDPIDEGWSAALASDEPPVEGDDDGAHESYSVCSRHQTRVPDCDLCDTVVTIGPYAFVTPAMGAMIDQLAAGDQAQATEPPSVILVTALAGIGGRPIMVGGYTEDIALDRLKGKVYATLDDGIPVEFVVEDGDTIATEPPTWRVVADVDDDGANDHCRFGVSVEIDDYTPSALAGTLDEAIDKLKMILVEHFDDGLPVAVQTEQPRGAKLRRIEDLPEFKTPDPRQVIGRTATVVVSLGPPSTATIVEMDAEPPPVLTAVTPAVANPGGVADPLDHLPSGLREYPGLTGDGDVFLSLIMMTTPKRAPLARCAWESILCQVAVDVPFEVVIVCDLLPNEAEHEHADDVYATYDGNPFRVRRIHKAFNSVTHKLLTALDEAQGTWVVMWDDDDWSSANRLAQTVDTIAGLDELDSGLDVDFISPVQTYRHEILKTGQRRTFTYTAPPTTKKRKGETRPICNCMAFRRVLHVNDPIEELPSTKAHHHDMGHWAMRRILDDESRVAKLPDNVTIVGIVHGANMNSTGQPTRVEKGTDKVLDGDEYTLVGDAGAVLPIMGVEALSAFQTAATASWR